MRLPRVIAKLRRSSSQLGWRSRRRDLRRELKEQSTEKYWRRRDRARSRRFRPLDVLGGVILSLLREFALGGLLLAPVVVLDMGLSLAPSEDSASRLGAFPTLAVQVTASLLGFYLASVGIVLGTSYRDVSNDVRDLVLRSSRTRFYLRAIGMTIGGGLGLVLLHNLGVSFGYATVGVYALLVAFSGWAFFRLAFGAFRLFHPITLRDEALLVLSQAIKRLDSKNLLGDEGALQAAAREANKALRILAELMDATSKRVQVDQDGLVSVVVGLLTRVRSYAQRKRLLVPTSTWFPQETVYPKWIEKDYSETSIALQTSTPLNASMEPTTDWLERRSAELASAALETCVGKDNRDAALRITREVGVTARTLAAYGRLDDAIVFAGIVRDRCLAITSENDAALAVAAEPPLLLSDLLLGWRYAIASWPEEVRDTVAATKWGRAKARAVEIHGPTRVWTTAQHLLREVGAEHEIQGRRATPDWYLRFALADEFIRSLREFADQLPKLLDDFLKPALAQPSPAVKAMAGSQALQALAKAQSLIDAIPQVIKELDGLRIGHDPQPTEDFEGLTGCVQANRSHVLAGIAEAITELQPERSPSEPDLFGEALFTLVHHTEQAIAKGDVEDVELVRKVFPKILCATLRLKEYMFATYKPPTYEYNTAIVDPVTDLLELSGLAMIYAVLRDGRTDDLVRQAWVDYVKSSVKPEDAAKHVLSMLDLSESSFSLGISPRRISWQTRLAGQIVEAYPRPEYVPFGSQPVWTAPKLIKMLGVSTSMSNLSIDPRAIFAADVIGPLSGESEESLRARPGLRRYYESRDFHIESDTSDETGEDENPDGGNASSQDGSVLNCRPHSQRCGAHQCRPGSYTKISTIVSFLTGTALTGTNCPPKGFLPIRLSHR